MQTDSTHDVTGAHHATAPARYAAGAVTGRPTSSSRPARPRALALMLGTLGALATFAAGTSTAEAAVRVYGEASSSGPDIRVQVFADITAPAVLSHSFRLYYPASVLQVEAAVRNATLWSLHDGSRPVDYAGPDVTTPGQVLFVGAHFNATSPGTGVQGDRLLLGTVVFRRLTTPDTPGFDLSIGRSGDFASFVSVNGSILEAVPGQVSIESIQPNDADQDLDGLSDRWEEKHFGSVKEVFYSDDPDKDGANNLSEETAGSDPQDAESVLRLDIAGDKERLSIEWPSAEGRIYILEAAKELGRFRPVLDGIEATPPRNTLKLDPAEFGDQTFFRIRVIAPTSGR